jgi:hypothetical protein
MPLPASHLRVLLHTIFGQHQGVDQVARDVIIRFLEYAGLDDTSLVYASASTDLTMPKLRQLYTTVEGLALLAEVEATGGQLAKLSTFLRSLNSGKVDRFMVDHDSSNTSHLELLIGGTKSNHAFQDDWTQYTVETSTAAEHTLTDSKSFRNLSTDIRTHLPDIAYLLGDLPQDNFSKIGKEKDNSLLKLLTIVLNKSSYTNTFKLGVTSRTGLSLYHVIKAHFLNDADTIVEIQDLQSQLSSLKMTKTSTVAGLIEESQGIVNSLKDLGKVITNLELYTKLRTELACEGTYLAMICVSFKTFHPVPDDTTLDAFLSFITKDKEAMAIGQPNKKLKDERTNVNNLDYKHTQRNKTKATKARNKLAATVAMSKLTVSGVALDPYAGCTPTMINFVTGIGRVKWSDETYGRYSNVKKVFDTHTDAKGDIDYNSFIQQMDREHASGKPKTPITQPPPPPRGNSKPPARNGNVSLANALEAIVNASKVEADIDPQDLTQVSDVRRFETLNDRA